MIFVDSCVWIDAFRGNHTPETDRLAGLIEAGSISTGDLIVAEVLQGASSEKRFELQRRMLMRFPIHYMGSVDIAIDAARNYRLLRGKGYTIRTTIDCIAATLCIDRDFELLTSDRDFAPFVQHLGLQLA